MHKSKAFTFKASQVHHSHLSNDIVWTSFVEGVFISRLDAGSSVKGSIAASDESGWRDTAASTAFSTSAAGMYRMSLVTARWRDDSAEACHSPGFYRHYLLAKDPTIVRHQRQSHLCVVRGSSHKKC
eukprot:2654776-Amphidinium_carterae.1